MKIMPIRIGIFKAATAIYQQTGISLLKYSGTNVIPVEQSFGGEIGSFYFVPIIAKYFKISSVLATECFLAGLVFSGIIIASGALCIISKTLLGRFISIIGMLSIGIISWLVGDVYVAYFFAIALFPWVLVLLEKEWYKALISYCFIAGMLLQCVHFIRSYAGLPVLIGISVVCCFFFKKKLKIVFPLGALFLGVLLVQLHIQSVIVKRNVYLNKMGVLLKDNPIEHTFWHNIYMGFGFISNDKNLEFSDTCSYEKVKQINFRAEYLKTEYENILRHEVLNLICKSPHYVLRVLFAKFGVLLYFLLLFANVGLVTAYYYPKPLYVEISYWIMIVISALPGILTIPITTYLLGFISACFLYGIHSIIYALNNRSGLL